MLSEVLLLLLGKCIFQCRCSARGRGRERERHSRSGRPFASLPSSLYGSGIAKQVFIARSRRAQELSQTNGNGTHGRGGEGGGGGGTKKG